MERYQTGDTDAQGTGELDDSELLEARRRKLTDKLLARGLITTDPPEDEDEEDNPARA